MKNKLGNQYHTDNRFKAAARLHQSRFRSNVLNVDFDEYGNRLTEADARSLLNYYQGLNVRKELRERYAAYSKIRDADMLRSEHIPFNMLAPLKENPDLARRVVASAFGIECQSPFEVQFEWAPGPKEHYLNDGTAFDTYIQAHDETGRKVGIGIEVKYTEHGYWIGETEDARVRNKSSRYWAVTKESELFVNDEDEMLGNDDMRQIWRNHLLGLAMCQRGEISEFVSIILYPSGNDHFNSAIPKYRQLIKPLHQEQVRGCTFEQFVDSISGDEEILRWKAYLSKRYLVD